MPARSKFTEARRRVILAALGCGSSRRTAAQIAGVDHATLGRWIERGAKASPGGRWRTFADAVLAAESDPKLAAFPNVEDEPDVTDAWRFLERTEFEPELVEPVTFRVSFHDGTPVGRND